MIRSNDEILADIQAIARQVFSRPDLELTRSTVADDVAEWDSISHMQLIMQVEKSFGIRLTIVEIAELNDVGALVDTVASKLD